MQETEHYKLTKDAPEDFYDVAKVGANMDKLDTALDGLEKGKAGLDPATGKVKPELLPPMNYDPAGSAAAVDTKLGQHIGNKANPHGVTASQVGARPSTWTPSASDVGAVPTARKVNGKPLTADITLTAADVGARPDTWMPDPVSVGGIPIVTTYTPAGGEDGVDYAADVPGVGELYKGLTIIADIHTTSASETMVALNVNGLGAKNIRRYLSTNTLGTTTQAAGNATWLRSGRTVQLMYNGTYWVLMGLTRPAATDLSGTVAVANGGTGRTSVPVGSYLVGDGTNVMPYKTPEQVAADVAPFMPSKRDADIRTYPVKAGESVQAGDVVDVVGGAVGKTWAGKLNDSGAFYSSSINPLGACILPGAIFICYSRSSSTYLCMAPFEGGRIGTFLYEPPVASVEVYRAKLVAVSDTMFMVTYSASYGTDVQLWEGTGYGASQREAIRLSGVGASHMDSVLIDSTRLFTAYSSAGLKTKITTVSGVTLSAGTEYALPGAAGASFISATQLPDLNGNKRVCVCYADGSDSSKGKAVIATISASNVVTWGTPFAFLSSSLYSGTSCCYKDGNVYVAFGGYANTASNLGVAVLDIAGGAFSKRADKLIGTSSANSPVSLVCNADDIILARVSNSPLGGVVGRLHWNGSTLSLKEEITLSTGSIGRIFAVPSSEHEAVVVYRDISNSGGGKFSNISFDDVSSQAIAIGSGTEGQNIEVVFDGTVYAPDFAKGDVVTSPGVQGYSPQDGWLWVKPWWDGAPTIAGTYVGDGAASKTISLGFQPSAVFVIYKGFVMTDGIWVRGGLAVKNAPIYTTGTVMSVTKDGFITFYNSGSGADTNHSGYVYHYIAFKE